MRLTGVEEKAVYDDFKLLLTDTAVYESMSKATNPYGDGFASKHIADILESAML